MNWFLDIMFCCLSTIYFHNMLLIFKLSGHLLQTHLHTCLGFPSQEILDQTAVPKVWYAGLPEAVLACEERKIIGLVCCGRNRGFYIIITE